MSKKNVKSCQKVIKKVVKKLSKSCKKLSKVVEKVDKKLTKSYQNFCLKVVKKMKFNKQWWGGGVGRGGEIVVPRPSASALLTG
jgi:hypothetical protein